MELTIIHSKIHEIRGQKVMLDFDLAELYEVEIRVLNQAVKRNIERFPEDFMFQLTSQEYNSLRSQFVTIEKGSKRGRHSKYGGYAFIEQGIAMLSSVLNSEKAIRVNIAIMRTFVALRRYALTYSELAEKIAELERKFEKEFSDINEVLKFLAEENQQRTDDIAALQSDPPRPPDWTDRPRIGFKK